MTQRLSETPFHARLRARNNVITNMRKRGATLREIAEWFKISRTRVQQILLNLEAQERRKAEAESMPFTLDSPISILQLSTRPSNALGNDNVKTVRELLAYSELDLLRTRNFGRVSLEEVKRALARHGRRLSDEPNPKLADRTARPETRPEAATANISGDVWLLSPQEATEILRRWWWQNHGGRT
jgi:hypothetical protein